MASIWLSMTGQNEAMAAADVLSASATPSPAARWRADPGADEQRAEPEARREAFPEGVTPNVAPGQRHQAARRPARYRVRSQNQMR